MATPDWLRLQRKIFTRWVNQKLNSTRGIPVNDVVDDFTDPSKLIALAEVLSEKKYEGKIGVTKMRVQKIDLAGRALKFVWGIGVNMKVKPSAENIVDGDERTILGLVWSIMLKFLKFGDDEDALNAKDALLMWVQNKTASYDNVKVNNFQKDWHNGLALCAIIHKHRPKLVDYDSLSASNSAENLKTAMAAAEKYFGLEQYLSVEDFGKLDENSMVVYVSEYYYGIAEQRKLDLAARRIAKVIKLTEENDKLRADYLAGAKKVAELIEKTATLLNDRTIDNTMEGAKKRLADFYDYKQNDKSVIIGDQLNLQSLYNNLAMRLSHNKRPKFEPAPPLDLKGIEAKISELEKVEIERKVALQAEYNRQLKLLDIDEQHKNKFSKLQAWGAEKKAYLETKEDIHSVGVAMFQLAKLDSHDKEVSQVVASTVSALKEQGSYLEAESYERTNEVKDREGQVDSSVAELQSLSAAKRPVLNDDLAREKFRESLKLQDNDHASKYKQLLQWVANRQTYLETKEEVNSVNDAQVQLTLLAASDADQESTNSSAVAALKALGADIRAQKYETEYSSASCENVDENQGRETDVDEKFATLSQLAASKKADLEADLAREQKKEELRLEFANLAGEFVRTTKEHQDSISQAHFGFNLAEVEAYQATLDSDDAAVTASLEEGKANCERVFNEGADLGVTENAYTTLALADLAAASDSVKSSLEQRRNGYSVELARQRANDALCQKFAGVADPFSQWMVEQKDTVTASEESLQAQLAFVEERLRNLDSEGARLEECKELQSQCDLAGITNNIHTSLTHKDVAVQWDQYKIFLERKKTMLEQAIETEKLRGLTAEQMQEIEENFKQFAKDDALEKKQLKACLYSLGEEKSNTDVENILANHGADNKMNYDAFREYMIQVLGDADTKEEIVDGFKLINKGSDVSTVEKMELVMGDHEVEYVKNTAPAKEDGYDYVAWTEDVYSR